MAVRISGVIIPNDKRVVIALTYIYGVGVKRSEFILEKTGIDVNTRVKDLNEDDVKKMRDIIEKEYTTEGDLRREVASDIKRLKEIGSYRGDRHSKKLPVRGQRTKTNNRTVRGNKKGTAGSGKKVSAQKT